MESLARAIWSILIAVTVLTASISPGISQNFFTEVGNVVTDPIKLRAASSDLSDSLERSLIQLNVLEAQVNYDAQERLEQIRTIAKEAIGGTDTVIANATQKMLALEAKINTDALDKIYRIECGVQKVLMDQLQRGFAQLIANVKKANAGISILGIKIINLDVNEIEINNPDQAYISTKEAILTALDAKVTEDSKAYEILSAYQNLESAAKFVRCYYKDQALDRRWVEEVNELERLSLPWVLIVSPKM